MPIRICSRDSTDLPHKQERKRDTATRIVMPDGSMKIKPSLYGEEPVEYLVLVISENKHGYTFEPDGGDSGICGKIKALADVVDAPQAQIDDANRRAGTKYVTQVFAPNGELLREEAHSTPLQYPVMITSDSLKLIEEAISRALREAEQRFKRIQEAVLSCGPHIDRLRKRTIANA
jgi:hypothetical protein